MDAVTKIQLQSIAEALADAADTLDAINQTEGMGDTKESRAECDIIYSAAKSLDEVREQIESII